MFQGHHPIVPGHQSMATPTRHFPGTGKYLHCELYGKTYPTSDLAHAAMLAHGYSQVYYPRTSTVSHCFRNSRSCNAAAKFDALYRLWKWKTRQAERQGALSKWPHAEMSALKRLAKDVTIFHPVANAWTSNHRRSDIKVS